MTTKVYPSNVIPDKNQVYSVNQSKKNYRPNNFMCEASGFVKGKRLGSTGNGNHEDEDEQLEIELTEDEFNYAVKMTEHSLRRLTKAHIIDLRQ